MSVAEATSDQLNYGPAQPARERLALVRLLSLSTPRGASVVAGDVPLDGDNQLGQLADFLVVALDCRAMVLGELVEACVNFSPVLQHEFNGAFNLFRCHASARFLGLPSSLSELE